MPKPNTSHLDNALSTALAKRKQQSTIRQLTTNPASSIDFSSNDFLSLATSQELRAAFLKELQTDPALADHLGSGGSRLLDGNSTYAERLENDIAEFHGAEAGLLCNSGYDANAGLFSCLPQPGDVVVYDEFIHASVHDGMRMSRATKLVHFTHNEPAALRRVLEDCVAEDEAMREGRRNVFISVEAVYSMDGDVAPLRDFVAVVKAVLPKGNGHLIVDEAHSNGIFGPKGRGLVSDLGLEREVTVRLHTFGKALACNGGILLCSPLIRQYLINYARPMIYTTFMSYPALAAVRASYLFLMSGKTVALAHNLQMLIRALHERLLEMQESLNLTTAVQHLLQCPQRCPDTPIFSILSSEPKILAAHCQRNGFVVRGILPPTVPEGTERIRVCLHAGNSVEQIDSLVATIRQWVAKRVRQLESGTDVRARL
ncbi:8-amino-7-oxononanoate synthase like protein [Zymoseptoria brevis]|uniref:8-amino-7-oxononanoate synthase like protein n=1 Tax=Zymoseptoria brevis TaxID=1047168 RepID=A0A0F4GFX1_9PEZI|nr:8-amino-7-oxononanoate synthase like protein [Zymoseptoria brevis]